MLKLTLTTLYNFKPFYFSISLLNSLCITITPMLLSNSHSDISCFGKLKLCSDDPPASPIVKPSELNKLEQIDENEQNAPTTGVESDNESAFAKSSPVKAHPHVANPLDLPKAVESEESSSTKAVEIAKSDVASIKISAAPQKAPEGRQFQKTRSFSAVEETPEEKISTSKSKEMKNFYFKDVAHSRSEQLETQPQSSSDNSKSKEVKTSKAEKCETSGTTAKTSTKLSVGDTDSIMRQYDYNEQPMSLQYDTTSVKIPDESRVSSEVRKSGRDLTELGLENMRDRRVNSNRANSRPRLEYYYNSLFHYTLIPQTQS